VIIRSGSTPWVAFVVLASSISMYWPCHAKAAPRYPDYPIKPISEYTHHQVDNGVAVAVHAIRQRDEVKTYFGADLVARGFLPVLIVVENQSEDASYMVSPKDFAYASGEGVDELRARPDHLGRGTAAGVVGGVSAVAISPVGLLVSGAMVVHSSKLSHNLKSKEFRTRSISPNRPSASGFIYVPVPKKDRDHRVLVRLTVKNMPEHEPQTYEFILGRSP